MRYFRALGIVLAALFTLMWGARPASAEMIAYYNFDQTLNDATPNSYHLSMGDPNPDYSSTLKIAGTHSFRINFNEGTNVNFHPNRAVSNMPKLISNTARQHLTITGWFRSTDEFASWRSVFSATNATATDTLFFATQGSHESRIWADFRDSNGVDVGTQDGYADPNLPRQTAVNQWQFIAMTWDGTDPMPFPGRADIYTARFGQTTLQHYTNEWTSSLIRQATDPTSVYFALGGIYTGDPFTNGYYDELSIWDETLTATQINGLFHRGLSALPVPEPTSAGVIVAAMFGLLSTRRRSRRTIGQQMPLSTSICRY